MKTLLIVLTLVEVLLLVAVLAGYLIAIAAKLRQISSTLGLVTFGVRAIERQTKPLAYQLGEINGALGLVADALEQVVGAKAPADADAKSADPAARPV